jgi:hypothetical protein
MDFPVWSDRWAIFATWGDVTFAIASLVLIVLLVLWWRQESRAWFRIVTATLLAALVLAIASYYMFVVPPHVAGCPQVCPGWRGYPLRFAQYNLDGGSEIAALDFAFNVLILWLLWLAATVIWRLLAAMVQLDVRGRRFRLLFVLLVGILPWAVLPRVLNPPAPQVEGEDLRLANNARRAAEFTYGITGVWVQRLALEDVRSATAGAEFGSVNEVCLRGYTYFFIPWQRYRISLDANGTTALSLEAMPLEGSCWPEDGQ